MTLRQVHYRLVSRDDVAHPNTISAYNTLGGWLRDDRLGGLVPWEWMEDRLRVAKGWQMWTDPAEFLSDVQSDYSRNPWSRSGVRRMHYLASSLTRFLPME